MKSVRSRIMLMMCALVVVSLLAVSVSSIYLNLHTTRLVSQQVMQETAKIASREVEYRISIYSTLTEATAKDSRLTNPNASLAQKQAVIDEVIKDHSVLMRGNVLDLNGNSIFTQDSFGDREYFQQAVKGNTWISDPIVSRVTNEIVVIIATPIWQNGIKGTTVQGVLYLVPTQSFLNDIVADIKLSDGAGAQIISSNGTIVAHPDMARVENAFNAQTEVKNDPTLEPIAALEREMMAGKTGFGEYTMSGIDKFLAYTPIRSTNGWSLGINAPVSDLMGSVYTSIIITIAVLIGCVIIAMLLSLRLANYIGKPLRTMAKDLSVIAETGKVDFDQSSMGQEQAYSHKKDEIGTIARSSIGLIHMLDRKVADLNTVANGDLSLDVICQSPDDAIGNALSKMVDSLNIMFAEINQAAMMVADSAGQVANGSQELAQSSSEQASSVEHLNLVVEEVSSKTTRNADMAKKAASLSDTIKQNAQKGSSQMERMMQAVSDINEASNSIGRVIKAIDDIAFQTNILALNAAVEAARAGQHGKGFAVVAEEVRSLAAKSAEAAKDTSGLISDSIEKSKLGYEMATETSASLKDIVAGIEQSAEIVSEIASLSSEQASAITNINMRIEQVAQGVQETSDSAQHSASVAESMSRQSATLKQLVAQFKLKEGQKYLQP